MRVEWHRVTWYSKLLALIVFFLVATIGFELGIQYERARIAIRELDAAASPFPSRPRHPHAPIFISMTYQDSSMRESWTMDILRDGTVQAHTGQQSAVTALPPLTVDELNELIVPVESFDYRSLSKEKQANSTLCDPARGGVLLRYEITTQHTFHDLDTCVLRIPTDTPPFSLLNVLMQKYRTVHQSL